MLAFIYVLIAILFRVVGTFATLGFVPLGASLLFFGSRMPRRHFWIPVAALALVDVYLTTQKYGLALKWDQLIIWAWYLGACFLGTVLRQRRTSVLWIGGTALAGSVSFFLVSNFAVWAAWNMYPHSFGGLLACYASALPFFRSGVASDLMFSALFFGVGAAVEQFSRAAAARRISA